MRFVVLIIALILALGAGFVAYNIVVGSKTDDQGGVVVATKET